MVSILDSGLRGAGLDGSLCCTLYTASRNNKLQLDGPLGLSFFMYQLTLYVYFFLQLISLLIVHMKQNDM